MQSCYSGLSAVRDASLGWPEGLARLVVRDHLERGHCAQSRGNEQRAHSGTGALEEERVSCLRYEATCRGKTTRYDYCCSGFCPYPLASAVKIKYHEINAFCVAPPRSQLHPTVLC